MSIIDVCLYNNKIYNLEDQSILGGIPIGDSITIYRHLNSIRSKYNIKFVIMGFNQPLRNAIYSLFPSATIILHPINVIQMINHYIGAAELIDNSEDEMAATAEGGQVTIHESGCQGIYAYHTKAEADSYYRQWQGNVPLGIKCFHHIIRIIDYYHEEIFNYFEFKPIFSAKT